LDVELTWLHASPAYRTPAIKCALLLNSGLGTNMYAAIHTDTDRQHRHNHHRERPDPGQDWTRDIASDLFFAFDVDQIDLGLEFDCCRLHSIDREG